jgi:hypothetical protein
MQSDKQHIDDFFRQKEKAFTPDEQHATAHWQQMQKQLTDNGASANPKNGSNGMRQIGKFLGGLLIVAIIAILAINTNRSNKKTNTSTTKKQSTAVAPQTIPKIKQHTVPATSETTTQSAPITTTNVKPVNKPKAPPVEAMTLISPPITRAEIPSNKTEALEFNNNQWGVSTKAFETKGPKPNAQTLLNLFYDSLQKDEQTFYIDAGQNMTITAKEGTHLTIPAYTFINKHGIIKGKVKIVVREYFKYEDILAAKLSTTSNGKQLVTGGMLHVRAEQNGEEVKIAPRNAISVSVPTDDYKPEMMLFKGIEQPSDIDNTTTLNWLPVRPFQAIAPPAPRIVTVLNLQKVEPVSVSYGKATTAKFYVGPQIEIPKTALIAQLKQRFGSYYDNIKLKKLRKKRHYYGPTMYDDNTSIIDSVQIDLTRAFQKRLLTKNDSIYYRGLLKKDSIELTKRIKLQKHYRFAITELGWINCDYFSGTVYPGVNLTVNLGLNNTISNCFSQLVFTRYKSVLQTYFFRGNKIQYQYVPEGAPVILVIVTVKDDQVMSCFKPLNISNTEVDNLVFEPTTPEQFKQKLQSLFASQQQ